MFKTILIANRGEIAVRIIRACKEMDIKTVAIYSEVDKESLHVKLADKAICVGQAMSEKSYLNMDAIISAALISGAEAIHPGFGFLSENSEFAQKVIDNGLVWIGPNPTVMEKMGNKSEAIKIMREARIPVVPGSYRAVSLQEGIKLVPSIGFPFLIKASAGGGGKGIRVCSNLKEFERLYNEAKDEAMKLFANDSIYLEKLVTNPRHVEVQVMADKLGNVIHLFERNCSMQRRKQKLLEECPCVGLKHEIKEKLYRYAVLACKKVLYDSVGTIEFLVDGNNVYFMEMNTRIQVEHSVTEEVTGIDLVKNMILIANGNKLKYKQEDIKLNGFGIECRINAEDLKNNFAPNPGKINFLHLPGGKGVRIDSSIYSGYSISPFYDSLILKLIVHGENREEAIKKMKVALEELIIDNLATTAEFFYMIMHHPTYLKGDFTTTFVDDVLKEYLDNGRFIHKA